MMGYLDFLTSNIQFIGNVKGVTNAEICAFEHDYNCSLPASYKEFISIVGKECEFCFFEYFLDDISYMRKVAENMIAENEDFLSQLSVDDFVFTQHQGSNFCFFKLSEGDDPPVYYYDEGIHYLDKRLQPPINSEGNTNPPKDFIKIASSFSDYIYEEFDLCVQQIQYLQGSRENPPSRKENRFIKR